MIGQHAGPALAGCIAILAAGCAKEEPVKFTKTDKAEQRVVFFAPILADAEPSIMVRTNRHSREEYVTWRAGGASAAFWYGSTFPESYWRRSLEHEHEMVLRRWKSMENASFELKRAGTVASPIGGIDYWRFRHEGRRECVAVNHFWTPSIGDQGGYRDWINGYFCEPEDVILTDTEIKEMISHLDVIKGGANPAGSRRD